MRVDEPVAICADRSPALIVGLLAILKAGGAYLPLDPSYPPERLAFMIEDGLDGVAKPVLLAQVDLLAASVAGAGARVIDLDSAAGPAGDADDPLLAPAGRRRRGGQPRLRHLHLGLDGAAEGRR